MAKSRITINDAALQRAIQPGIAQLQEQLNEQLHATIREVRDEMQGRPAAEVYPVLVERIQRDVPGFNVNEENMQTLAAEIEAGTLNG